MNRTRWAVMAGMIFAAAFLVAATSINTTRLDNRIVDFAGAQLRFNPQSSLTNEDGLWGISHAQLQSLALGNASSWTNAAASNLFNTSSGPIPTGILTAGTTNGGGHLLVVNAGTRYNTFDGSLLTNLNISVSFLPTNAIASWPTGPQARGGAALINSNGTIYLLTSLANSATWAATNKLAP